MNKNERLDCISLEPRDLFKQRREPRMHRHDANCRRSMKTTKRREPAIDAGTANGRCHDVAIEIVAYGVATNPAPLN